MIPRQIEGFNFVLLGGDGKQPIEKAWQTRIRKINSSEFREHIKAGKNYGVQGNNSSIKLKDKTYFLVVVDFDKKELQDKVISQFPETFTTTSGSPKKCVHLWFASDNNKSFKILDSQSNTLADVLGEGKQVVAPGSKHHSGSTYSVVKDIPIAFIPYSEIKAILMPHDQTPKKPEKPQKQYVPKGLVNDVTEKILGYTSMKDVLNELGIDTSKNLTMCYFHDSVGGHCLGWNEVTAHCFHCDKSWNKFSLIREAKNLTDKQTFEWFAEKAGMLAELEKSRKEYGKRKNITSNGSKNTTTPTLPTTTHYIKSWGYFSIEDKLIIEQVAPYTYIYNKDGKIEIITAEKIKELDEDTGKAKTIGYGFQIDDQRYMVKSMYQASLFYNTPDLAKCYDFISGKYKPRSYKEIRADIRKILKEMYDFKGETDVETCLMCIDQTWLKPGLSSCFFLGIDSTFGGGKTTLGENNFFLMRHGFVGGNISSASIPRLTDELDLNVFIDEIDQNLNDENLLAILRKGQRRGNPYVRCEGRDNKPVAYDVFGCHGFSFRAELEDAFMNRALRIHTQKSSDYRLPVLNTYKKDILKPLADELFLWFMQNLVATCSRHSEVLPVSGTRNDIYFSLVSKFSAAEREYLTQVLGRDAEIVYLALDNAKTLGLDLLGDLKVIMDSRKVDEASSESFYYDSLRDYIIINQGRLTKERLIDGIYGGCGFYPKNRLYQEFIQNLKSLNVQAIGTKKFTSLLRDFGFIEGDTLMSERYGENKYGTPCLIFSDKMLISLGIRERVENLKVSEEKIK